jgi:plasmid stabilization system protein ParE
MTSAIAYSPKALNEFKEAVKWYEEQSAGLGMLLAMEIQSKIKLIGKFPDRYRATRGFYRETMIRKFPFIIVYRLNKTKKIITKDHYNFCYSPYKQKS